MVLELCRPTSLFFTFLLSERPLRLFRTRRMGLEEAHVAGLAIETDNTCAWTQTNVSRGRLTCAVVSLKRLAST